MILKDSIERYKLLITYWKVLEALMRDNLFFCLTNFVLRVRDSLIAS
jgi:hypothetical protein